MSVFKEAASICQIHLDNWGRRPPKIQHTTKEWIIEMLRNVSTMKREDRVELPEHIHGEQFQRVRLE